jgi:hypothetical protein
LHALLLIQRLEHQTRVEVRQNLRPQRLRAGGGGEQLHPVAWSISSNDLERRVAGVEVREFAHYDGEVRTLRPCFTNIIAFRAPETARQLRAQLIEHRVDSGRVSGVDARAVLVR